MSERFFYHSFPRPRQSMAGEPAKGLKILSSICQNGLLLVPESVSWSDPSATQATDRIRAIQRRICFTELAPEELQTHAKVFGAFALEFTVSNLRQFGAMPIFYVPDSPDASFDLSGVATSLLGRLADARQIIECVAAMAQLSGPTIEIDLKMKDGALRTRKFNEIETRAIQDYARFLSAGPGQPLQEIASALNALASIFYPTENLQFNEPLAYYRQREWRIFSGMHLGGKPVTQPTTPRQQQELIEIDSNFFSRTVTFPDGTWTRAQKSHYFQNIGGNSVLSRVNRIIVPASFAESAKAILREANVNLAVVPLENLGENGIEQS